MSFLVAGGHRLEYRLVAPFSKRASARALPTLVFLHEGLGSVSLWKDFPDLVVEATGNPALVYSRYGYGKSDRITAPRKVDYLHREALEVLPEVLATLGIESPLLIGHSDGASIAIICAGARRWPVRALVLLAPHVFVEDIAVENIAQAKVAFETTEMRAKLARRHDDPVSTFWGWNDIWLHPDFRAWNIESFLPQIDVPMLLIQGRDDQYGTLAQIEAVSRQVRGPVEQIILPDCTHSPHVDQKEATLEAIAKFVRAHS
jgi:pimeloyl-ACP methyl ester carboxylesterase